MSIKSTKIADPANDVSQTKQFRYEASTDIQSVYNQMDVVDKKIPMKNGLLAFLVTLFLGVPIWFAFLLPFTIVASAIHFGYVLISGGKLFSNSKKSGKTTIDSVFDASEDENIEIVPMESRKYDVVLLGATGYTGKLATTYLAKQYGVGSKSTVNWAIAGRSKAKLNQTLESISMELGNVDVKNVDVIITDTSDKTTLKNLVTDTRAVITTAGPFQKYGSPVVEFCVKYGTHYADITGEVDWNKKMMKRYESSALKTGSKLVSFCGHDSVPWDLTVRHLSNKLREDCNDDLEYVECLDEMKGAASGGTLATVYESLDQAVKEFELEFGGNPLDLYERLPDGSESPYKVISDLPSTVSQCRNPSPRFANKWCSPFFMAPINMAIVQRSVALSLARKSITPVKYREAAVAENFMDAFTMWFGLIIISTLIFNPVTRQILKKLLPQPGEGPSEKTRMEGFLCVSGYGIGVKGNKAESVMYFPQDGGYHSTARMLVESGLCLALDGEKHSYSDGGFYSPASIMCDPLVDRLVKTGSKFACAIERK